MLRLRHAPPPPGSASSRQKQRIPMKCVKKAKQGVTGHTHTHTHLHFVSLSCIYAFVCIVCVRVPACVCVCVGCGEQAEEEAGWLEGVFIYLLPSGLRRFRRDMATLVLGLLALVCLWPGSARLGSALPKP